MKKVRDDILEWSRLAQRLQRLGTDLTRVKFTSEKGLADPRLVGLLLMFRTVSNSKAAITLAKKGMIVEARILTRACIENFLWVAALRVQGEKFVKKMQAHDLKHKQIRGHVLLAALPQMDQRVRDGLHATLRKIGKETDLKTITPKDVAAASPVGIAYAIYQHLSSDSAHPTTDALRRHLSAGEHELQLKLTTKSSLKRDEDVQTMWWTCLALLGVCMGVHDMAPDKKLERRIEKLHQSYRRLYSTLAHAH